MSRYRIQVRLGRRLPPSVATRLKRAAAVVLDHHGALPGSELTIVLTSDEEVRRLNREWRGIDKPTDVLSFGLDFSLPNGREYLGDVVIAVPIAEAQAQAAGHDLQAELSLLTIHGVLHLLGYDHAGEDDRKAMWTIQEDILSQLDVRARPTES